MNKIDPVLSFLFVVYLICVVLMCKSTSKIKGEILPIDTNYSDTMHLAAIINAECGICDESEQRKTGSVILNRVESDKYPDDIFCVIIEDNQFRGYYTRNYYPRPSCLKIAKELLNGIGRVDSILYFWNPKTVTDTNFINKMQDRILYKEKFHHYAY